MPAARIAQSIVADIEIATRNLARSHRREKLGKVNTWIEQKVIYNKKITAPSNSEALVDQEGLLKRKGLGDLNFLWDALVVEAILAHVMRHRQQRERPCWR